MGKVVCHMDKSKAGGSGGLSNHIDRTQQKEKSKNVNHSKSHLNFELVKKSGTIDQMVKERIAKGYQGKKAVRKDAVTSQRYILSGSHDSMMKLDKLQLMQWAKDNYDFFADKYGEENIVRATVHMDEKTPHMHLIVVPLTKEGKLSAKEFTGTRKKLKELQTDYAKKVGQKYGLERGVEGSNRKHITTKDYYRYVNANDMTAQKLLEHPNSKDLISKLIQMADNNKGLEHIAHKKTLNHGREFPERTEQREKSRGQEKSNNRGFSQGM